jgi:hypothetical protein
MVAKADEQHAETRKLISDLIEAHTMDIVNLEARGYSNGMGTAVVLGVEILASGMRPMQVAFALATLIDDIVREKRGDSMPAMVTTDEVGHG